MPDMALICRIFDPTPTDDLVTKRTEGVNTLANTWKGKKNVEDLLRIAAGVAIGLNDPTTLPQELAREAVSQLNKNSPALMYEEHELEVVACSAAALLLWIESITPQSGYPLTTDACVAGGLWSAMAVQAPSTNPRLEHLRQKLLAASRECVLAYGRATRDRTAVPDAASEASISALRENAIRDREELNVLWWAINDYSEILNKPLSLASEIPRAVVGALELSRLMRRLPSESQKHLAIRHVQRSKPTTFKAVVRGLGSDRETIAKTYTENARVSGFPIIFPLLSAIASDDHKVDDSMTLPLTEWAKHIVLEGCVAIMTLSIRPET